MKRSDRNPCRTSRSIPAFVQHELSEREARSLSRHLETCPRCREDLKACRLVFNRLHELPSFRVGRDHSRELRDRLFPRPVRTRPWLAAGMSAACAAILLAVLLFTADESADPPHISPQVPAALHEPVFTRENEVLGRALTWLSEVQNPGGDWNPEQWGGEGIYTPGLTGLVITAYFGAEDNPLQGPHADTVFQGLRYLRRSLRDSGQFGPRGPALVYNQSLGTLALLEASNFPRARVPASEAQRALSCLVNLQRVHGGFGWDERSQSPTSSASAWAVQTLLLGDEAGWTGAAHPAQETLHWMKSLMDSRGRMGYRSPGDFPYGSSGLTAAGAFHILPAPANTPKERDLREHLVRTLSSHASSRLDPDYVHWYFLTYACLAAGDSGSLASAWDLQKRLASRQVKSGPLAGSWEPLDRWSTAGGRIYSTAMAALTLEARLRSQRLLSGLRRVW